MSHYKVTYFPLRARAEPIRIILTLAGASWEDNRHMSDDDLIELNKKGVCPFGQLPIVECDGVVLAQSMAILRYLAKKFGYVPENDLQCAVADAVVDQAQDIVLKVIRMWFEKDSKKKEEDKKNLYENVFPQNFNYFDKILKANSNGKTFFFGDKITYADINFFCFVNGFVGNGEIDVPDVLKKFPDLVKLYNGVMNQPAVLAYLKQRPKSDR